MKLRANNIEKLAAREFDVLIIGGGVNGAVSASALTSQGASVALIDRGDFASFTSQESSNLVWGGIKYMESYEFGLVRKLCLSRNRLMRTYPSTVQEIRFFTSLTGSGRAPRWLVWIGAWVYYFIGNLFTRSPRLLSVSGIQHAEPAVRTDKVVGGVEYSDAFLHDNDARFVFGFVREALTHGGICANYVESLGAERQGDRWVCRARDVLEGEEFEIRARVVINACGPFVDEHNGLTKVTTNHRHLYSRGIHLIVDRITDERRVLTFFADDGRMFFVIPMGPKSCIGTTDTRQEDLPPRVTEEDRAFVLENINKRLNLERPLTNDDIIAERCGVRPLVVERGEGDTGEGDWTTLSRKHAIEVERERGHISIFGGKLTDCLNVGEEVAAAVQACGVRLPHSGFRWYGEPPDEVRDEFMHQAKLMGLDALTAPESSEPLSVRLWRRYASSALVLLEDIRQDPSMAEVLIRGAEYIRCELHHAARREMVTKLEDFLRRRSKIALIARKETMRKAPGMFEACVILFGEDEAEAKFAEYFGEPPDEQLKRWSSPHIPRTA